MLVGIIGQTDCGESPIKLKLLIVEDDSDMRDLIQRMLGKERFDYFEAANAKEAEACLSCEAIDLILCDLIMPGDGGLTFVTKKNSSPAFAHIPVIMVTSEGTDAMQKSARELGVELWLMKPFKKAQALATIEQALTKYALGSPR